jgi:NAD(P)-dependent dehydrogenase (short-subunit alcohol dehydrogenase family)
MSTAQASDVADFSGRTALITGAASGIGAAVARWLDARGVAELVLVDIDAAGLEALELSCQARHYVGDVADPALWEAVERSLTRLDHALINAGVANGGPLAENDYAEWRRIMSVNLDGAFLGLRCALRAMKRSGGKSVVLTSSVVGVKPTAPSAAYGASKAAVAQLAQIAAAEHFADGIRVNAVAPGRVETPIWTKTDGFAELEQGLGSREAALKALADQLDKAGGFVMPEVLAGQIGFLLSDEAENVTGTVLVSAGGYGL